MNTISIKLDDKLERKLLALSRRERVSKSELVRRALHAYGAEHEHSAPVPSALSKAGDLVGCLKGAPSDLASNPEHLADFGRV